MEKRPFIIDCDTGTDDAIAIIAAVNSPEIEVKAITSVNGNIHQEYVCQNNLDLIELLGRDIPVAKGAEKSLFDIGRKNAEKIHGKKGLGTVTLPPAQHSKFHPTIASELIYQTAVEEAGQLELLVIGPMTNIAIALIQHTDLADKIKHIWFMGGAVKGGNVTNVAEFNIWADPEACREVLGSGIPMTMVGLDVTERSNLLPEDEIRLRGAETPGAAFAADILQFMFNRRKDGEKTAYMHDSLALAAAIYPECLTCREYYVEVECGDKIGSGHTEVDLRGESGREANVSVAMDVDAAKFRKWLVDRVSQ